MLKKVGKRHFAILLGKITTDSWSATIKKLAFLQAKRFAQLVPATLCAGPNHVLFALEHASSAIDSGQAFSRKPELEFLAHFFGEKQIFRALEKAKFAQGEALVMVVEVKNKKDATEAKKTIGFVEDKKLAFHGTDKAGLMREFGISENSLATVADLENPLEQLVIEHISAVALEK